MISTGRALPFLLAISCGSAPSSKARSASVEGPALSTEQSSAAAPSADSPTQVALAPARAPADMVPAPSELPPLAYLGQSCDRCIFDQKCQVVRNENSASACCDYSGGSEYDAWPPAPHVALCLALILGAPHAPEPARGELEPLARVGDECKSCAFNGRCALLVDGRHPSELPCCDYSWGASASEWPTEDEFTPRCLGYQVRDAQAREATRQSPTSTRLQSRPSAR